MDKIYHSADQQSQTIGQREEWSVKMTSILQYFVFRFMDRLIF